MLTQAQEVTFRNRGVIRLPGVLPTEISHRTREEIVRLAEKVGCLAEGCWQREPLAGDGHHKTATRYNKLVKRLRKVTGRNGFMTSSLHAAMDELVGGAALTSWSEKSELLFSRPASRGDITAPPASASATVRPPRGPFPWHVDVPRLATTGVTGVQMFTFLHTVESGGGGTAIVTGSHRLLNGVAVRLKEIKRELEREPFFRALYARDRGDGAGLFETTGRAGGVDLEVVELVGEPGDVYLMDLRVLHTRCSNTRPTPRMMITQRFVLESVRPQLKYRYFGLAAT